MDRKRDRGRKCYGILAFGLSVSLGLGGCGNMQKKTAGQDMLTAPEVIVGSVATANSAPEKVTLLDVSDMFSNRDREIGYDELESIRISLAGDTAQADADSVKVDGNVVTITSEGCYILSGSLSGRLVIDAGKKDKIHLVLDGANISCASSAALYVKQADKVFVTLAMDSENLFATEGEYVAVDDHNIDGAVYARDDITFNGEGKLKVISAVGNGIVCKDDLVITGGQYEIAAGKHGLEGKDSVRIENGTINIEATEDGIHSGNDEDETVGYTYIAGGDITLAVKDDGIHSDTWLVIAGGNIHVAESYEGLEGKSVEITGGEIHIKASDDGINAAGGNDGSGMKGGSSGDPFAANGDNKILISGGKITVDAAGDGIDSNGDFSVSGGEILVYGPTNGGNGALDFNGEAVINGGTVIAIGASPMAENFGSGSEQCSMLVNVQDMQEAGTSVELRDASGTVLMDCVSEKKYNSVVFSCPEIQVGQSYTVVMGAETTEVEMTETIYGSGMGGFRGHGGMGGFGGERPDFGGFGGGNGERPDFGDFNGERPDFGEWPDFGGFDGERPDFGEWPDFGGFDGEHPDFGDFDGERPDFGDGQGGMRDPNRKKDFKGKGDRGGFPGGNSSGAQESTQL